MQPAAVYALKDSAPASQVQKRTSSQGIGSGLVRGPAVGQAEPRAVGLGRPTSGMMGSCGEVLAIALSTEGVSAGVTTVEGVLGDRGGIPTSGSRTGVAAAEVSHRGKRLKMLVALPGNAGSASRAMTRNQSAQRQRGAS